MTVIQILALPAAMPTILLTTAALHYAMFGHGTRTAKLSLLAVALLAPSLLVPIVSMTMPVRTSNENLMPGLGEAMLLVVCGMLTAVSYTMRTLHRRLTKHF